jgi:adenylate cyclase
VAYKLFYRAAAKPVGLVNFMPDDDFIVRQHLHVSPDTNETRFSSISWETAALMGVPAAQNPLRRNEPRWMNYYGRPGSIPFISYSKALAPETPADIFSNKVVFVGARLATVFSGQRKDEYVTPYTKKGEFTGGVEVQATQFVNLMRADWLRRAPIEIESRIIVLAGIIFGFGLMFLRPFIALLAGALVAALFVLVARYCFLNYLVWFPWLIVVGVQIPMAAVWSWGFNSFRMYVQNRLLEQSLSAYVSPARVKEVLRKPDVLKPGADKQMLSILFSDIAGFTSISEGMDSDELARIMNNYFEGAVSRIHETDGTVIKFIGDAIFAIWNAPLEQHDHQLRAARGGLLLSRAVDTFIQTGGPKLITRIGLHAGVANVGNFGSAKRFDYTAIGENINLASRMEGLNKYTGTTVLATGDIQAAVGDKMLWRFIGKFKLKGFDKAVVVHELVDDPSKAEATKTWRDAFANAVAHFEKAQFAEAKAGFEQVIALRGSDGPSDFYLHYLEEHPHSPGPNWHGEIEMKEK